MSGRAKALMVLLCICTGLATITVVFDVMEYSLLDRIERADFASRGEAVSAVEANDNRQKSMGVVQIGFLLFTGILFIAWFFGMYTNLAGMSRRTRFGTGWAIGGWFVPILNLWRPKQIADEIYLASDPQYGSGDPKWTANTVTPFLHWWWGVWIVALLAGRVSTTLSRDTTSVDDLKDAVLAGLVSDFLLVIAGFLAIIVVRTLTDRQTEWARRHLNREAISSQA
jgi:hypothetical protein